MTLSQISLPLGLKPLLRMALRAKRLAIDSALHVESAPAVQFSVPDLASPGVQGPLVERLRRDHVHVPVEDQGTGLGRTFQNSHHVGPVFVRVGDLDVRFVALYLFEFGIKGVHLQTHLFELAFDELLGLQLLPDQAGNP